MVTLVGNLSGDPELRFTPSGVAVVKLRMAQPPRTKDGNEWKDGEPFWINVTAWRQLAENVAETLTSGMRVIVMGRLEQRTYDHRDGHKVTVVELTADAIGPDLTWATAKVTRVGKSDGNASRPAARQAPAQAETPPSASW